MKNAIVITSIFSPTEAVIAFSNMSNYQVIVVGDMNTPSNWNYANVDYLCVAAQEKMDFQIAKVLPYNHYSRKMLGYLKAIQSGVNFIIDTDDDNIPKKNWVFPEFESDFQSIAENKGFVNVYQLYTSQKIWPRGLPLKYINKSFNLEASLEIKDGRIGIWQGLADEDPDVDAIYRLTSDLPCYFDEREPVVLCKGTISPFNTQNTMVRKELFCLMYLPTYVTFRFTDILRGLVAQPIMWLHGYQLGFTNATVIQKRNPHDYMKDFISEIPMYEHCEKVIEVVSSSISSSDSMESNLFNAYEKLMENNIVSKSELIVLEAWLNDVQKYSVRQ